MFHWLDWKCMQGEPRGSRECQGPAICLSRLTIKSYKHVLVYANLFSQPLCQRRVPTLKMGKLRQSRSNMQSISAASTELDPKISHCLDIYYLHLTRPQEPVLQVPWPDPAWRTPLSDTQVKQQPRKCCWRNQTSPHMHTAQGAAATQV